MAPDGLARSAARASAPGALVLLEALPDAAMVVDAERRIVAVNARLTRLIDRPGAFRRTPERFAAMARRLALAGEYLFLGIGDMIDGDGRGRGDGDDTPRRREIAAGSGRRLRVTATALADGGTLLCFAPCGEMPDTDDSVAAEIVRHLAGAVVHLNPRDDGTVLFDYAGPNSAQIFGIDPQRLVTEKRSLIDFIAAEDRDRTIAVFGGLHDAPVAIDTEFRIVRDDGAPLWTRMVGSIFVAPDGGTRCDVRIIDVNDRVQMSVDRRRLQLLLQLVVENIPHIVTVRNARDMRYVLINKAASNILGVDRNALLGQSAIGIMPEPVRERRRDFNRRVMETLRPVEFPEILVETPQLGSRLFRTTKYPLLDDEGVLRYVLSINEDITESRQTQDALQRGEQRLREALESFSDGVALFDRHDRLVLCNRRYREMWPGMDTAATPGVTYGELVRAVIQANGVRNRVANLEAYIAERVHYHLHPPSTREVPLANGRWIQVSDRPTAEGGIVVTCTDITALKEREDSLRRTGREAMRAKEAAEMASRSKSDFLANMSHELRTPLNAVIGFSEIIKDALLGDDPEKFSHYRAYATDIHASGRHLLALINDILDMSKIEAGKLELVEEPVDVPQIVEASMVLVRERAQRSNIVLSVALPEAMPRLRSDMRKVKQILINLLSNAVKFTEPGGHVTVSGSVEGSGELVLRVADSGIGIRPEDVSRALEPFGQVDGGLARRHEGTGLGLSLTKSLVELHGGRLEISSRWEGPDTGTTVTAYFPASRVVNRRDGMPPGIR